MTPLLKLLKWLTILTTLFFGQATFASVEEGLALLQQDEIFLAIDAMQPEIGAEDPEALFWQARIYMSMGGMERFEIGRLLLRSAEQGYPWAMMNLVESDYEHCRYFMLPCDDKWFDKAIEKWQQLAANGDGKAMFMLAKHKDTWRKYVPYLAHRTRVAQYEQALEMGANRAAIALYNELSQHQDIKDPAIREQAVKYLTVAAERNYAPAMVELSHFEDITGKNDKERYLRQAMELGFAEAASLLAEPYAWVDSDEPGGIGYKVKTDNTPEEWEKYYTLSKIEEGLDTKYGTSLARERLFSNKLKPETMAKLDQEVAEFLIKVKPNRFYDETNLY
ncbi:hypothetical protein Q4519_20750 [Motilimonas sp. 1_MG-2023]|uniref:hypothetical protein n=1 Tax=Motilimonas sp. 1_MG-2023 TaxID=3062672 RepID=UPI0026E23156|nr:hypothetical protein [Motilimonas sp. 1_MG-2023]MDO6528105.1 hypothetical protein [Motilimonas sp. 1_MG-2023]